MSTCLEERECRSCLGLPEREVADLETSVRTATGPSTVRAFFFLPLVCIEADSSSRPPSGSLQVLPTSSSSTLSGCTTRRNASLANAGQSRLFPLFPLPSSLSLLLYLSPPKPNLSLFLLPATAQEEASAEPTSSKPKTDPSNEPTRSTTLSRTSTRTSPTEEPTSPLGSRDRG